MNRFKYTIALIGLILISNGTLFAENQPERSDYDWEAAPELSDYTTKDTNVALVYLKNYESHEFFDEEDGSLREYVLVHRRIKVFTDRGIEQLNKLYLPVFEDKAYLIEKARVINSKGEVIVLRKEDIKEGMDEETERKYRYFALEGIDKGSEIEYLYMYDRSPRYNGNLHNVQYGSLQMNFDYEMITPYRLDMAFKIYNDDKEFVSDTSETIEEKEKSRWYIHYDSVPALASERSSAYEAELIYFGYKLSQNYATNAKDLFNYGELSKMVYKRYQEEIGKKDLKFSKKIAKKVDVPKNATERQTIRAIEEYVKSHVRIIDAKLSGDIEMEELWDAQIFSINRAVILFSQIFDHYDIKYQIGLTSNRFDYKFDPKFENWKFANKFIFYFPGIDDYMTPKYYDRLGFPDFEYINNYGLFVKRVEIAGDKYGVGNTQFIPKNDYKNSGDTLRVSVDFNQQGFTDTEYDVYHSVSGYKAQYIQPFFEEIDDKEDKKETEESMLTFLDEDGEVKELEVNNLNVASYGLAPVTSKGILQSDKFFEKARENYLFKVGELIGPQMEMYSKKDRKLPVEEYFARHYYRTIVFTIPDGYTAENLDKLNIDESYENEDGEQTMKFKSEYTREGNKVTITISELYKDIIFPVAVFEDYQRVINAAADFNKVVVIFDKKG